VDTGKNVNLTLMVNPQGFAALEVKANGHGILAQSFDTEPKRAWEQNISGPHLSSVGNTPTATKTGGTGDISPPDFNVDYETP
jgi:hypothetical protein